MSLLVNTVYHLSLCKLLIPSASMSYGITEEHVGIVRQVLTQYVISDDVLGSGASGIVFAGEHKESKQKVAVKIQLDLQMYKQERTAAARITHPHSVALLDYGHTVKPTVAWLVFPRVETSVKALCKTWRENPHQASLLHRCKMAATMLAQLMPLLKHLEQQNVSHSDLQWGNILVDTKEPTFYVTDYGIARDFETKSTENYYTDAKLLMFTARAMIVNDKWTTNVKGAFPPGKIPDWLTEIVGIIFSIPEGAKVPYERIEKIAKDAAETGEDLITAIEFSTVHKGMLMLNKYRAVFEALLNRCLSQLRIGPAKLKTVDDMVTGNDIQVLRPHPNVRVYVYAEGKEPWLLIDINNRHIKLEAETAIHYTRAAENIILGRLDDMPPLEPGD